MQALIDNDVYAKIAKYGLLTSFNQILHEKGYSTPHGRLAAAPYKLSVWGKKAGRGWSDAQKCQALSDFFQNYTQPVTGPSEAALVALNVPFFDTGEIKLLARAVDEANSHIMTGDKNALRALAKEPSLSAYAVKMAARAVHFEIIMRSLCEKVSYGAVRSAVLAAPAIDNGLDKIFAEADSARGLSALDNSITRLRAQTGSLLVMKF